MWYAADTCIENTGKLKNNNDDNDNNNDNVCGLALDVLPGLALLRGHSSAPWRNGPLTAGHGGDYAETRDNIISTGPPWDNGRHGAIRVLIGVRHCRVCYQRVYRRRENDIVLRTRTPKATVAVVVDANLVAATAESIVRLAATRNIYIKKKLQ